MVRLVELELWTAHWRHGRGVGIALAVHQQVHRQVAHGSWSGLKASAWLLGPICLRVGPSPSLPWSSIPMTPLCPATKCYHKTLPPNPSRTPLPLYPSTPLPPPPDPSNPSTNKRLLDEVAQVPSKRLRNKISGFTTHLMKRIQKGPVRGISFRLQEEERERKDQYVPDVSALHVSAESPLEVDSETKDLLQSLGLESLPVNVTNVSAYQPRERKGRYVPGAGKA